MWHPLAVMAWSMAWRVLHAHMDKLFIQKSQTTVREICKIGNTAYFGEFSIIRTEKCLIREKSD